MFALFTQFTQESNCQNEITGEAGNGEQKERRKKERKELEPKKNV